MSLQRLLDALGNANVQAFLRVIRNGESDQTDDAYRMLCFGGHFESFVDHPRIHKLLSTHEVVDNWRDYPNKTSSAAGAYQITETTWGGLVREYGFTDFSPRCQDMAAVALLDRRGALAHVIAGRLDAAIRLLTQEWTSFALARRQQEAPQVFTEFGGVLSVAPAGGLLPQPIATPEKVKPMGIFAALLPTIIDLIPQLASVFKPGSEVAQRNVAAATIVTKAISEATQAVNLQDAVEKMQNNPAALAAAQKAVNDVWPSLVEPGPGVSEARKVAADPAQTPPWKNPAVWVTLMFVPLIYGAAWAVLYRDGISDDLKTMVVTAIFAGLLGSITGFFLGSSLGSQRKDALMNK